MVPSHRCSTMGMAKTDAVLQKDKYDFTKLNTLSVVSLATALTGFGFVAAIITGHISLAQIKRTGQNGRALAIAGVVIGYASIALWILGSIAMIVFRFYAGSRYGVDIPDGGMMNGWNNDSNNRFGPGMMTNN